MGNTYRIQWKIPYCVTKRSCRSYPLIQMTIPILQLYILLNLVGGKPSKGRREWAVIGMFRRR